MDLIKVDPSLCRIDNICVAECPPKIIVATGKSPYPFIPEELEALCIDCGHCVAVCPYEALTHQNIPLEDCKPLEDDLKISEAQAVQFLTSRRSIRTYQRRSVEREKLLKLLEIANLAPNANNVQPVKWKVIENTDEVKRLTQMVIEWMQFMIKNNPVIANRYHMDRIVEHHEKGIDRVSRGAPHLIIAYHKKDVVPLDRDCTIAISYLELAAYGLGLGACWAGFFNTAASMYPPLIDALALPKDHQIAGSLLIGYPRYKYYRIPTRKPLKVDWV
jgi:nitroreductase/NAD-dependent dihydropyrimidine dehydrogenase PreA subunit